MSIIPDWRQGGRSGSGVVADPGWSGLTNMEAMIVTVDRPVVSKTLLKKNGAGYQPVHVNAALIAPEVVAVFPITLEGR